MGFLVLPFPCKGTIFFVERKESFSTSGVNKGMYDGDSLPLRPKQNDEFIMITIDQLNNLLERKEALRGYL